jgi:hypothetical protein
MWVMNDPEARAAKAKEAESLASEYRADVLNGILAGYYQELIQAH